MAYKDKTQKTAYQNKYISENYDRVNLTIPKGDLDVFKEIAEQNGESVSKFFRKPAYENLVRQDRQIYRKAAGCTFMKLPKSKQESDDFWQQLYVVKNEITGLEEGVFTFEEIHEDAGELYYGVLKANGRTVWGDD